MSPGAADSRLRCPSVTLEHFEETEFERLPTCAHVWGIGPVRVCAGLGFGV